MKKAYGKPLVSVEVMSLDQPIAANCVADKDDVKGMMMVGYFVQEYECAYCEVAGGFDATGDGVADPEFNWGNDTICYHSNIQQAFLS